MTENTETMQGGARKIDDASLSEPIESLLVGEGAHSLTCDVVIVGSGYGAAFAALELSSKTDLDIIVLERGREYALGEFPEDIGELPGHIQFQRPNDTLPIGYADGLFDFRAESEVSVLTGCGLGGTSLINAGVVLRPQADVFKNEHWPSEITSDEMEPYFKCVESLLGAKPYPPGKELSKYKALAQLAKSVPGATCDVLPIAVSSEDGPNDCGVEQSKCIDCGNCVTGCNHGAKNSLPMNVIPLARSSGARFYTGCTVRSVEPCDSKINGAEKRWKVHCLRTATVKGPTPESFEIHAKFVILAAGSLGSTEILLRSKVAHRLPVSEELGRRFSGNGDFLAASYAQEHIVDGVANAGLNGQALRIGPTIVGAVKGKDFLIEDGAVPAALATAIGSLLATLSVPQRYVKSDLPGWHANNAGVDLLAVHPDALRRTQILLGIGRDTAEGRLALQGDRLRISWPSAAHQAIHDRFHKMFVSAEQQGGLDGGDYLPNPLWQALPEQFAELTGVSPRLGIITVHPLGGCRIGNTHLDGVVNHYGNVFDPTGSAKTAHAGLYVLDGSIIPGALGVNPLLTIAALSLRAAGHLAKGLGQKLDMDSASEQYPVPLAVRSQQVPAAAKVGVEFLEFLTVRGPIKRTGAVGQLPEFRNADASGQLVVEIKFLMPDVWGWLADPSAALGTTIVLHRQNVESDVVVIDHLQPLARGSGSLKLLADDSPKTALERLVRVWQVFSAFRKRRSFSLLSALFAVVVENLRSERKAPSAGPIETVKGFWRFLVNHTRWRRMTYSLELYLDSDAEKKTKLKLFGEKVLAYTLNDKNPWSALIELDITITSPQLSGAVTGSTAVDVIGMIQDRRLQVVDSPNTPTTITALAGVGLMFFRALFATHFWSFRGIDYEKIEPARIPQPGAIKVPKTGWVKPTVYRIPVPRSKGSPDTITTLLSSYSGQREVKGKPILLIHAHAMSGELFTTNSIRKNLASFLVENGFDVWVLDYRLSPRLGDVARQPSSMDDIAENDIPAAVKFVYERYGNKPIDLFAHCIGSGCTAMAILSGRLHDHARDRSMIGHLVAHAVYPWVVPSWHNRLSAGLGAFFKDVVGDPLIDVHPPQSSTLLDEVIDRIAATFPWEPSELDLHWKDFSESEAVRAVCDRSALIYGRMFRHANIEPQFHQAFGGMIGVSSFDIFRQFFYLVLRYRITGSDGSNRYLTAVSIEKYWTFHTLFAHGSENGLFNPASAVRSAEILRQLRKKPKPEVQRIELFAAEKTGHLDFIAGKNASKSFSSELPGSGIYPDIVKFLNDSDQSAGRNKMREEFERRYFLHNRATRTPCVGPIFNYSLSEDDVVLHVWLEQSTLVTAIPMAADLTRMVNGRAADVVSCSDLTETWKAAASSFVLPGQFWYGAIHISIDSNSPSTAPDGVDVQILYVDPVSGNKAADVLMDFRVKKYFLEGIDFENIFNSDKEPILSIDSESISKPVECDIQLRGRPWFDKLIDDHVGNKNPNWSFLCGSCRWPGIVFEQEKIDSIFHSMGVQADSHEIGVDALFLLGDQIYADATANIVKTRVPAERFTAQYRNAFSGDAIGQERFPSKNCAELLRKLPAWMVVDDHEYGDDWSGLSAGVTEEMLSDGFAAALAYQWRQPPSSPLGAPAFLPDVRGFWQISNIRGLPFFMMDTRSERKLRTVANWRTAALFGAAQEAALLQWLCSADSRVPKIILCGSPLGLIRRQELLIPSNCINSDTWTGYPASVDRVLRFVASKNIGNVIFVSGDPHFTAASRLEISNGQNTVNAYSICVGGLNATLPFANAKEHEYVFDSAVGVSLPNVRNGLSVKVYGRFISGAQRQFVRLDLKNGNQGSLELSVTAFSENGTQSGTAWVETLT